MECDPNIRKQLYSNIVLTVDNTMLPGIAERLHNKISHLASNITDIKIIAARDRKYSTWTGGSMLATMGWLEKLLIHKIEYD